MSKSKDVDRRSVARHCYAAIANDICRCIDNECWQAEQCLRYLLRSNLGERTPIAYSMRDGVAVGGQCLSEIKAEPGTWIRWRGGNQPVSDNTKVEVKFESQPEEDDTTGIAKHFSWVHQSEDYYMNIVAFRVIPSA